ncbi:hypothetical protein [Hyperthermus butylicus]|uniref:hypothetical protein n=1 Tax=Hyperthermus butylicus TaxID=54248 RepID=UPI00129BAC05|nr:hypothetical protein [Hyperthermus butylicus]
MRMRIELKLDIKTSTIIAFVIAIYGFIVGILSDNTVLQAISTVNAIMLALLLIRIVRGEV